MWAVTHVCRILPASCLFDYTLIGLICPQQKPFGADSWGSCFAGLAAKRFGRASGSGVAFCSQKGLTPAEIYKHSFTNSSGWVCVCHPTPAVQSWCFWTASPLLLLEGDADPM